MSTGSSYRTGHHGHAKLKPDISAPDWGDEECLIPGNTGPLEYLLYLPILEPTYCNSTSLCLFFFHSILIM